jgi:N-acetylmuramoyl-L-alanine amidase
VYGGFREADIALTWAQALQSVLVSRGHYTMLTRTDSITPCPLGTRVQKARLFAADLLLSLHCNASPDGSADPRGTECHYRLSQHLAEVFSSTVAASLGLKNRGAVANPELAVLKGPMPSVLLELGFLSSPTDRTAMTDITARSLAVMALATAIEREVTPCA